ncbi:MAG: hypothetical protein H6609_18845 [Ignavibacteriales bacterium]|nr:hypothetical protein [Ignavibacteriales bacterium]
MIKILKQKKTYYYLLAGILSTIIGYAIVEETESQLGLVIIFMGVVFIVSSFTYKIQKPKSFLILLFSSIGSFIVFALLHNIFEGLGDGTIFKSIGAFFFILAIILCPAAITVGIIGFIVRQFQEEKK